jgi:hypothetical protein
MIQLELPDDTPEGYRFEIEVKAHTYVIRATPVERGVSNSKRGWLR